MDSISTDLKGVKLPRSQTVAEEVDLLANKEELTETELNSRLEKILRMRIDRGDSQALFQLGQLYFEQGRCEDAQIYFKQSLRRCEDPQSMFQLAVILYDDLTGQVDQKAAVNLMQDICARRDHLPSKQLYFCAAYNLGRAYFQGHGVKQSDEEAEKWWLIAADDGNPKACVLAQTTLGYFYCHPDRLDLPKAFFWHNEACGNGSLESQGALGVMYFYGLGVKRKDSASAFECLREAAERGNVYSQGHMVYYYYTQKLFTRAAELAARVVQYEDVEKIAEETDCQPRFVSKGISLACFMFARCLHQGLGVKEDLAKARELYSRSFRFDSDTCARLQALQNVGQI